MFQLGRRCQKMLLNTENYNAMQNDVAFVLCKTWKTIMDSPNSNVQNPRKKNTASLRRSYTKLNISPQSSSQYFHISPPDCMSFYHPATRENPPMCVIHYSDPFLNLPSGRDRSTARQVSAMYLPSTGSTRRVATRTNCGPVRGAIGFRVVGRSCGQQRVFLFGDAKLNTCIIPS